MNYNLKDINLEIWNRLLNDIPYLWKSKGTIRSIRSLINCYGIPSTMLDVKEYSSINSGNYDLYKNYSIIDRFLYSLKFTGGQYFSLPWQEIIDGDNVIRPGAIEFTFNTNAPQSSNILYLYDGDNYISIDLNFIDSTTSTIILSSRYNSIDYESESDSYNFIDNKPIHIALLYNYDTGKLECKVSKLLESNNIYSQTLDITMSSEAWTTTTILKIGQSYVGTLFEFRLWKYYLQSYVIEDHVKNPQSVVGNDYTSSYDELLIHYTFNDPMNHYSTSPHVIKNLAKHILADASLIGTVIDEDWFLLIVNNIIATLSPLDKIQCWLPGAEDYILSTEFGEYILTDSDLELFVDLDTSLILSYLNLDFLVSKTDIISYLLNYIYPGYPIFYGFENETTFPYNYQSLYVSSIVNSINTGVYTASTNKIRYNENWLPSGSILNPYTRVETSNYKDIKDPKLIGIYLSPTNLINDDIVNRFGFINISDIMGDPRDKYNYEYSTITDLSNLYWANNKIKPSFNEYISYLTQYDLKGLFNSIKNLLPARNTNILGVLYEPTLFERYKTKTYKPSSEIKSITSNIINESQPEVTSTYNNVISNINYAELYSIYCDNFNTTNIYNYNIITTYDYNSSSLSGSVSPNYEQLVNFEDYILNKNFTNTYKYSMYQSFNSSSGLYYNSERHYNSHRGYNEYEQRLKYIGCLTDETNTYNKLSPVIINIVEPKKIYVNKTGKSNLEIS